jgi:mycothiol system anti-sigma-R factor
VSDHSECTAYLERIVYFLDNELDEADIVEVRLHLDGCGPCHEQYDVQRAIKSLVARSCVEQAPDELRSRVLFKLREVQVRVTEI